MGRSRGGFGTKFHLVTDGSALPMAVEVTAGQVHESTRFESVMKAAPILRCRKRPRRRPKSVAGDKGYSYSRIRAWLRRHKIKAICRIASGT